jgi:hypothetical protein
VVLLHKEIPSQSLLKIGMPQEPGFDEVAELDFSIEWPIWPK